MSSHLIATERDINVTVPSLATTARVVVVVAKRSTRLAAIIAVDQVISLRLAATVAVLALEDTSLHIRQAATGGTRADDVTAHVDLARDIESTVLSRGEFTPGIEDLAVLAEGSLVVVEGSETTGDTVGEGDGDLVANVGQRVRNHGGSDVHEARLVVVGSIVPDNDCDGDGRRVGGVVGKSESAGAVIADPDVAVVAEVVLSLAGHADVGHVLAIFLGEAVDRSAAVESAALEGSGSLVGGSGGGKANGRGKGSKLEEHFEGMCGYIW